MISANHTRGWGWADIPYEEFSLVLIVLIAVIRLIHHSFAQSRLGAGLLGDRLAAAEQSWNRAVFRLIMFGVLVVAILAFTDLTPYGAVVMPSQVTRTMIIAALVLLGGFLLLEIYWMIYIRDYKRRLTHSNQGELAHFPDFTFSGVFYPAGNPYTLAAVPAFRSHLERYTQIFLLLVGVVLVIRQTVSASGNPAKFDLAMTIAYTLAVAWLVYAVNRGIDLLTIDIQSRRLALRPVLFNTIIRLVMVGVTLVTIALFPDALYELLVTALLIGLLTLDLIWLVYVIVLLTRPVPDLGSGEAPLVVEEVFLVENSGNLILHETRRLRPNSDDDMLMGMFTAIQGFMSETLGREQSGGLNTLRYGGQTILLEHGPFCYLAVVIEGEENPRIRYAMQDTITTVNKRWSRQLKDWDGDIRTLKGLKDYVGEFTQQRF